MWDYSEKCLWNWPIFFNTLYIFIVLSFTLIFCCCACLFTNCWCFTWIFTFLQREQPGVQSIPDLWPLWEPLPLFPGGVSPTAQVNKRTQWIFNTDSTRKHILTYTYWNLEAHKKPESLKWMKAIRPLLNSHLLWLQWQTTQKCLVTLSTWFCGDISINIFFIVSTDAWSLLRATIHLSSSSPLSRLSLPKMQSLSRYITISLLYKIYTE